MYIRLFWLESCWWAWGIQVFVAARPHRVNNARQGEGHNRRGEGSKSDRPRHPPPRLYKDNLDQFLRDRTIDQAGTTTNFGLFQGWAWRGGQFRKWKQLDFGGALPKQKSNEPLQAIPKQLCALPRLQKAEYWIGARLLNASLKLKVLWVWRLAYSPEH